MREVIVLHPILEKNLSQFFKIPSGFPGNSLGRQVVKLCEKMVFDLGESGFWRGKWYSGPPLGW
jgi:hypothetical protein